MPENLHFYTDGTSLKSIDLPQYPDSAWNWITGAPEDTKDEELYARVAAVYRVANLSAEAIANVPFAVYKGETEYDTSDDWQNKVGFLPNIRELLRLWRLSLFMTNSAYGFMEGNRAVKNLRYVVPSTITPQIDKWEGLTGFKRRIGTETTEYSLKDNRIFWMWRLDHTTELLPSKNSEFKALMAAAGVLYYADYYVQNFFQRGGIRPALLQVAGVPTREEREKIETVWDKIIHGWSKYLGKVISANEMDVKVIGDGIDNVANGQIHSEKLADVAMAAGMPLSIILANSANYATAQTEYLVWFRDSVVPWANFMQDELNDKLFKPLGLHFEFRPEMSDKGQEEERQRAGAYRAYVASGMKPSIAAQVVGIDLPPDIEYADLDDVFVPPVPQPVNETEIQIEEEEMPKPEEEKSVTLLTIDQLRELEHWQDLAFRKLKQGKSLAFPWVSKTLPEEVASTIRDRLPGCKTTAEIERAFDLNMPDTPDRQLRELADALNKAVEAVEVKYSPNQPRVPAGNSDGGQWTDGGSGGSKLISETLQKDYELALALSNYWYRNIPLTPEMARRFDKISQKENETTGEWAERIITERNILSTIENSGDILSLSDKAKLEEIAKLNNGMFYPYRVIIADKIEIDAFGENMQEWGYDNQYQLRPSNLIAVGGWEPPTDSKPYWTITLVDNPGTSLSESFWHEFSHTLPDFIVEKYAGNRGDMLSGDWHDLFARIMSGK